MIGLYKLAELNIEIKSLHDEVHKLCRDYVSDNPEIDFSVETCQEDIVFEHERSEKEDLHEGIAIRRFSEGYLETLAVYRKIAERLPSYERILMHGSAIAMDGKGVLFTAKSGTGKSTHARLWKEVFGDRVISINDDKPIISLEEGSEGGATIYGTPWDGKHRLSTNTSAPLKAICILERAEVNSIKPITAAEAYLMLLQQIYRPFDPVALAQTLKLIDKLSSSVSLWRLGCNMDKEAAQVAYEAMEAYFKMKLRKDFLLHDTGRESILVPTGNAAFSGVMRGNKTLGAVLELLKKETSYEELAAAMRQRFDAPEGTIETDVTKVIEELRKIGALDE